MHQRSKHTFIPTEIPDSDSRIMLQMLLTEARRFHLEARQRHQRGPSKRCPVTPATPVWPSRAAGCDLSASGCDRLTSLGSSPGSDSMLLANDSICSSPGDVLGHPNLNAVAGHTPNPSPCPSSDDDNSSISNGVCDGWADLQMQIEEAWAADVGAPHAVRYQRVKSYLTWMFIWDTEREWSEFETVSAQASLDWITERQVRRLNALPPGQLFADQSSPQQ